MPQKVTSKLSIKIVTSDETNFEAMFLIYIQLQRQGYYRRFLQMLSDILFPCHTLQEAYKDGHAVLLLLVPGFCADVHFLTRSWK